LAGAPLLLMGLAPRVITSVAAATFPGCRYSVPRGDGRGPPGIALTIDDAPDPATTPAILDVLESNGAHATFFVITNQLQSGPGAADPMLARMLADGNELGNHFTHDRPAIRLDSAAFDLDLAQADSVLRRYAPVRWVRPSSGWYSRRMVRRMRQAGYQCALGSVYPLDAGLGWPWLSKRYILAHSRPGAIIILHDRGVRGERTADVLGEVLPALRARGYRVVTLSELALPAAGGTGRPSHSPSAGKP